MVNVTRAVIAARSRGLVLADYAVAAILRTMLEQLSPEELAYLNTHTLDTYQTWIEAKLKDPVFKENKALQNKILNDVETLPDGHSHLMWIGNRHTAKKVILFLHGGGYIFPMLPGHCEWASRYVEAFAGTGAEVAVALLEYTLCPPAKYPSQFRQTAAALQYLLDAGWKPSNIIIGGDSVGGQMTHNILSHIASPHPQVNPVNIEEPLAGAFMVSPFVSLNTSTKSYERNYNIDMLSPNIIARTKANSFDHTSAQSEIVDGKGWLMPMDVPESWVSGWSIATKNIYITAGKNEGFATKCKELADRLRNQCEKSLSVVYEEPDAESHDWILLEGLQKRKGDATERMLNWTREVIAA